MNMFLELIATAFAGVAAAGLMLLLNHLLGGRLPRWLTPVGAGVAMIIATISSEYGWYDRTAATLPEGLDIVQTVENRSFYRPWTQVAPYIERFAAVDTGTIRSNPDLPGQYLADLYFFGRWSPVNRMPVLIDCDGLRRAELSDGAEFAATGEVTNAQWVPVPADDPVLVSVCGE